MVQGSWFGVRRLEGIMGFNFEKLEVYKKSLETVNKVYLCTKVFPKEELFGLTMQIRKAAVSIALNVSEGSAKSKKDFSRFIDIARGSVYECITILKIAGMQKYLNSQKVNELTQDFTRISKMLSGLKKSMNNEL